MVQRFSRSIPLTLAALVVLAIARPALAGPPLLCHPFEIGTERSLPWGSGTTWFDTRPDYDVSTLAADTGRLLVPTTPVLVRMETLRRAVIYATRSRDAAAALMSMVERRAAAAGRSGRPAAMAYLDAAYVTEAFREFSALEQVDRYRDSARVARSVVGKATGRTLIRQSLAARPDDPSLEFAAALITADNDRAAYEAHARRARAGASRDVLLKKNIGQIAE